jgi:hypothetical protein
MFQNVYTAMRLAVIACLFLAFALSPAWGLTIIQQNFYSGSTVVKKGAKGGFFLTNGKDKINIAIEKNSLDAYLDELGINQVTIWCDLKEELVDLGNGINFYRLTFTFGPSGAYFTPEALILTLSGKYASEDTKVSLYDENGEAVESNRQGSADTIKFYIPHFSSYYYDGYY